MSNRKIIDYTLLVVGTMENFNIRISNMIRDGWQPYGYPYRHDGWHHQAMVKYEDRL